ncbi:MAG TPA: efflux RND transporter periplasmic adaptor subunit [Gemmatimonadales bacterium]|nr:efflux RND transporter periplasmic adaptor subunit [Gemmatimonadales bacterium]
MPDPAHDLSKLRIDREAPPPPRRLNPRILILAAVAIGVVGALVAFLRGGSAVPVEAVVAENLSGSAGAPASGATVVTANGYVVAQTRAAVSAKVAGRLAMLSVDGGSVVKRGEVIARLENADYQAAVSEQEANLAVSRANLIEAESERDQSSRDYTRVHEIRAANPNLISAQDEEAARSRMEQADARARASRARVDAAEASLRFAQVNLENTFIRAPFSGTVLRKEAEVGEVVAPSVGGGLTRGAVVTMADLQTLEVEVDVNEAYIGRVHHGQAARITLDAYPDTAFRGSVRQVVPTADRQRATVQVKVGILDRDPRILPEMGARVDFEAPPAAADTTGSATAPPRFRLPVAAVRDQNGTTVVWLIRNGRLEPRPVDAGPASAGFREVRSGLTGGELVLTGGVESPKAGMKVQVQAP